ncbi:hypothetical protein V1511DRAFT_514857 [Dipodascopsis uninucleata]
MNSKEDTRSDLLTLSKVFLLVKSILFTIPQLVVSQYDTSSQLIFNSSEAPKWLSYGLSRFIVWDTVFFIKIAQRGYIYEQEWAFGWLWTRLIRWVGDITIAPILKFLWPSIPSELDDLGESVNSVYSYGIAAVTIAHVGHYLATVMIYFLAKKLEHTVTGKTNTSFPLIVGLLYVISPGGIFLSSGYSETVFAFCSFLGAYFRETDRYISSGIAFAICCLLRGNGVLWGIVFLNDLYEMIKNRRWFKAIEVIIGGILVGLGFFSIQFLAYIRYCPGREWCQNIPPLIYGYVQSHYWNVGFFKYWRTWQIPNFFFAFPTWFFFWRSFLRFKSVERLRPYLIIQMLMLMMSLFIWHVQIITRVGTCMPLVYLYLAERIGKDEEKSKSQKTESNSTQKHGLIERLKSDFKRHEGLWSVRYMVTWIGVQAVLYASFIPPA